MLCGKLLSGSRSDADCSETAPGSTQDIACITGGLYGSLSNPGRTQTTIGRRSIGIRPHSTFRSGALYEAQMRRRVRCNSPRNLPGVRFKPCRFAGELCWASSGSNRRSGLAGKLVPAVASFVLSCATAMKKRAAAAAHFEGEIFKFKDTPVLFIKAVERYRYRPWSLASTAPTRT